MSQHAQRYSPELRDRAVQMVAETKTKHRSDWAAIVQVAEQLGVGAPETVRRWVLHAGASPARPATLTAGEAAEVDALKRENAELARERDELKHANLELRRTNAELLRVNGILRGVANFFLTESERLEP
ncbi:transposase [Motilibacter peucedani]|uniref:Transposase n=1 Tax=Motilibacter peucedani TaxID=598650 RepID=A0A420XUH8_9ACTN|nr:transposase [Motilibacter peucedani]RKS80417.1 transposase [Motilibacter peucedani]